MRPTFNPGYSAVTLVRPGSSLELRETYSTYIKKLNKLYSLIGLPAITFSKTIAQAGEEEAINASFDLLNNFVSFVKLAYSPDLKISEAADYTFRRLKETPEVRKLADALSSTLHSEVITALADVTAYYYVAFTAETSLANRFTARFYEALLSHPNTAVLDIGCGMGGIPLLRRPDIDRSIEITLLEKDPFICRLLRKIQQDQQAAANPRVNIIENDFFSLPEEIKYDTLMVALTFRHIPSERQAEFLSKCRRLMKPGRGRLIIIESPSDIDNKLIINSIRRHYPGAGLELEPNSKIASVPVDQDHKMFYMVFQPAA
ncbi:class I SAM-dependent methyltransferase [Candidatus Margulisiibacteriota bacterium]